MSAAAERLPAPAFRVRIARPADIPALMQLKFLLAEGENAAHAVRAPLAAWLRDGFGPDAGFTAFVAESQNPGGSQIVGMATCSKRIVTGWDGPVLFLQDMYVERRYRCHGVAKMLLAQVAAVAKEIGSPIVELTVLDENEIAKSFYQRAGFMPLPQCLTYVLGGPALLALADGAEAPD